MRKSPSSIMLTALCVTNLLYIWVDGINSWTQRGLGFTVKNITYTCLVWPAIATFISQYMEYIMALVAVFRCIMLAPYAWPS